MHFAAALLLTLNTALALTLAIHTDGMEFVAVEEGESFIGVGMLTEAEKWLNVTKKWLERITGARN